MDIKERLALLGLRVRDGMSEGAAMKRVVIITALFCFAIVLLIAGVAVGYHYGQREAETRLGKRVKEAEDRLKSCQSQVDAEHAQFDAITREATMLTTQKWDLWVERDALRRNFNILTPYIDAGRLVILDKGR